ncbi:MAG: cytochrome b subunit of the bc complex [Anaerolineae bacterium]|nr:cytochrome b subunit of the bc complex [Anaerolineae bacterium]
METTEPEHDSIPFYPNLFRIELYVTIGLMVIVLIVGMLGQMHPVGLGEPADPLSTPAHIKPEWYFLALYQAIKFVPKTAGVLLPILGMLLVMLWPFIDRRPDTSRRARWIRAGIVTMFFIVISGLTVWGALS